MRALYISLANFCLAEELLFSSLLRLLKPELKDDWKLTDPSRRADVTFTRLGLESESSGLRPGAREIEVSVQSNHLSAMGVGTRLVIPIPMRSDQVYALLNRVGAAVRDRFRLATAVSGWSDPHDVLATLVELRQHEIGPGLRLEAQEGGGLDLNLMGTDGNWSIHDDSRFDAFRQAVQTGQLVRLMPTPDITPGPSLARGNLSSVLWILAMARPSKALAQPLNEKSLFHLTSWPDFGALRCDASLIQLASLLTSRHMGLPEILGVSRVGTGQTLSFLNACFYLAILRQAEPVAIQPRLGTFELPMTAGTATYPSARAAPRRLFDRVRLALGLMS